MTLVDPKQPRDRNGAAHLERQSALRKRISEIRLQPRLLVVEDTALDAQFLVTPLRRLFGADAEIEVASSLAALADRLGRKTFDVILLDDRLGPETKAETSLPLIQKAMPGVPVIVVSRLLTRARLVELQRLGAVKVLDKEDTNSVALGQIILEVLGHRS